MKLLITGGSGTLGRELCQQLHNHELTIITNDEYQWHLMKTDFPNVRSIICDIRDYVRLEEVIRYGEDGIIHCAALKHVGAGELFPMQVVDTNIQGTHNLVKLAKDAGIKKLVALSSDKAVYPVNLYGATKMIGEKIVLHYGYTVVRSGNFWGSRGSVVEIWNKQKATGTITITDPEATRYFITPEMVARFVIECLDKPSGVYIPPMDKYTMAQVARLIAPDCQWYITGLAKGEKKDEVLDY